MWKSSAAAVLLWFLSERIPLTSVFVFQEMTVGGGWVGWEEEEGGGGVKIWQIAENCLHAVIPVWTHLAHLVVIWQEKCADRALSSQTGATFTLPTPTSFPLSSGSACRCMDQPPPTLHEQHGVVVPAKFLHLYGVCWSLIHANNFWPKKC